MPAVRFIFPVENLSKPRSRLGNEVCPLSPCRLLYKPELLEKSRSEVNEILIKERGLWKLLVFGACTEERLLLRDVCGADIVSHMTDGSSADYGILTFGIASNIFDKLASFYIWFNPQYKSHENSKLKIIQWAGNNQIPHIFPPNDRFWHVEIPQREQEYFLAHLN